MDKSLVEVNEKSIFYKIKNFFANLFKKKESMPGVEGKVVPMPKKSTSLKEEIRGIDSKEISLLELQNRYKEGLIKQNEMTHEQIEALCDLYDRQNEKLRKSIEYKKQKILKYRESLKVS